ALEVENTKIDILRTIIPLRTVQPSKRPSRITAFLGTQDADLEPVAIDLSQRGPHFVVVGPPLSGKTNTIRAWTLSLANLYSPKDVMIILVDFQQRFFRYGGKRNLGELPHVLECISTVEQMEKTLLYLRAEYETPDRNLNTHPRPEIYLIADSYDEFNNVFGSGVSTRSTVYKDLNDLARKYGPDGFHAVLCGSLAVMRQQDDFFRGVMSSRYAIGLDSGESASQLGGRVRGGGGGEEFPPGRGYVVRSGKISLMQIATPQEGGAAMEDALDQWVGDIVSRFKPTDKAQWYLDSRPDLLAVLMNAAGAPAAAAPTFGGIPAAGAAAPVAATPNADEFAKLLAEQEKLKKEVAEFDPWAALEVENTKIETGTVVTGTAAPKPENGQEGAAPEASAEEPKPESKGKADKKKTPEAGDK
ncbi:partial Type VII secretion system protein EssC, partial [Anaerolineales bacterium]